MTDLPLSGLKIVDLSTLLPGPLATLLLAEAGARVIKVERPPAGDEMRGMSAAAFALLNRGKESLTLDLKTEDGRAGLLDLLGDADVLVEQFRPGVLARLGLAPKQLLTRFPKLVICSITGYGQTGGRAAEAGHDLVYMARAGLLSLSRGSDGAPVVPPVLAADVAGGAWPAVMNILLALQARARSGQGAHLDIPMTDNLFPFAFLQLAGGFSGAGWEQGGDGLLTGGSPRYRVYRTLDGRFLAVAALEQRFWDRFCELVGLDVELRDDHADPAATMAAVARIVSDRDAGHWARLFAGEDVCCAIAATPEEAANDPAFAARGLLDRKVRLAGGDCLPALPLPLDPALRDIAAEKPSPSLGGNDDVD
jgi:crotonobetainyl-CoA:carnitine CoA-transferase CaiB-like acyl-CoA transferase